MIRLAFDKSARMIDKDGMLHVNKCHITKATVNPYYGNEIPNYQQLGLEPTRIYNLLRHPEELAKAAPTFKGKPILSKHVHIKADNLPRELIIGTIGSNVEFESPYLNADLSFWENGAIVAIDNKQIEELSCAYYYDAVMEPGEYEGLRYDGYMTNIIGNHLAHVEVGRAGSDVIVADEKPRRNDSMKMSKLGKALIAALGLLSPKIAADSALPGLIGTATFKDFNKPEVVKKLLAMDADLDGGLLEEIIESILGIEGEEAPKVTVEDEGSDPSSKVRAMLEGKVDDAVIAEICTMLQPVAAMDTDKNENEDKMDKEEVKAAMDAMRAELLEAQDAIITVRPVVGDITVAMDSATKVYQFALDQMKVDYAGVTDSKALKALFKAASSNRQEPSKPGLAQDSAPADLYKQFPNAARFKHA